jgi:hypothetical protein
MGLRKTGKMPLTSGLGYLFFWKIRGNGFKVVFSSDTVEVAVPNTEKDSSHPV